VSRKFRCICFGAFVETLPSRIEAGQMAASMVDRPLICLACMGLSNEWADMPMEDFPFH
jgi:hypothetical protein